MIQPVFENLNRSFGEIRHSDILAVLDLSDLESTFVLEVVFDVVVGGRGTGELVVEK